MRELLWLGYRAGRRWWYTVRGKNPLVRGSAAPSLAEEYRSVKGLIQGQTPAPQRAKTDAEGFTLWRTSLGEFWTPPGASEDYVGRLAVEMQAHVYSLDRMRDSGRLAGSVMIDCGGNVGFFARWAFQQGAGRIVCLEPSPKNAECLRRNLAAEIAAGRATVVEKGVWDADTTLRFSTANLGNPGGHHVADNGEGDISVVVTSIDEVARTLGLDKVDYIKIDVEGAELRALSGARATIGRWKPQLCVVSEHTDDLYENACQVIKSMKELGPGYAHVVTEAHPYESPSQGMILTPYTTLFYAQG